MSKPELADSPTDADRLSDLPEALLLHILSFLPTKLAVRTSVLSHRFRRLWTASPSMDIDRYDFPRGRSFYSTTSRCIRSHDPSASLLSFSLSAYDPDGCHRNLAAKTASKWLNRAYSLGLRNLNLEIYTDDCLSLLPLILTFHSLQSLKICCRDTEGPFFLRKGKSVIPPNFLATSLKSLHLKVKIPCSDLKRLVMEQSNLEDLCVDVPNHCASTIDLVSRSVKRAKLICNSYPEVNLFLPALEVLELTISADWLVKKFSAEMPLLRKADLKLASLTEAKVPLLSDFLRCFVNVLHLSIHVQNSYPSEPEPVPGLSRARRKKTLAKRQFHLLVAPGKDLSTFPHLRSLKLLMLFHEDGISDLICFLQNAPVLESVELHHVDNEYRRDEGGWNSQLPLDSEGNNQHAHFSDLHLGERKIELIRLLVLCNENPQKKLKTW